MFLRSVDVLTVGRLMFCLIPSEASGDLMPVNQVKQENEFN